MWFVIIRPFTILTITMEGKFFNLIPKGLS